MRFLLSLSVWILIVGGMWLYTWQRDAGLPDRPSQARAVEMIQGDYTLEITPTFSVEKDPFALDTGEEEGGMSLALNGREIPLEGEEIARGRRVRIDGLTGFRAGTNEIFVKASPTRSDANMDHALRVRLTDRGFVIVDRTVWGGGGSLVSGTVSFELKEDGGHDH